jgi:hypothetical protein
LHRKGFSTSKSGRGGAHAGRHRTSIAQERRFLVRRRPRPVPTSPCCIDPFDRRSETLSRPFGTPSLPRPPPSYASALVDPAKLRKVRSARAHGRASRTLAERVAGVLRPHLHRLLLWPK